MLWETLDRISILLGILLAIIPLYAGMKKWIFPNWMKKSRRNSWIEHREAKPVKALIAAVGLGDGETAAETSIKYHAPELQHCWLLVTKQADKNFQKFMSVTAAIIMRMKPRGLVIPVMTAIL